MWLLGLLYGCHEAARNWLLELVVDADGDTVISWQWKVFLSVLNIDHSHQTVPANLTSHKRGMETSTVMSLVPVIISEPVGPKANIFYYTADANRLEFIWRLQYWHVGYHNNYVVYCVIKNHFKKSFTTTASRAVSSVCWINPSVSELVCAISTLCVNVLLCMT